jgi:phosphoribosylformylglycinamidine synthase
MESFWARVVVMPKPVVNDPEGITIRNALRSLGFGEVEEVRAGKNLELHLAAESEMEARSRVEEMAKGMLANHVIEDYRIDIDAAPFSAPPEAVP